MVDKIEDQNIAETENTVDNTKPIQSEWDLNKVETTEWLNTQPEVQTAEAEQLPTEESQITWIPEETIETTTEIKPQEEISSEIEKRAVEEFWWDMQETETFVRQLDQLSQNQNLSNVFSDRDRFNEFFDFNNLTKQQQNIANAFFQSKNVKDEESIFNELRQGIKIFNSDVKNTPEYKIAQERLRKFQTFSNMTPADLVENFDAWILTEKDINDLQRDPNTAPLVREMQQLQNTLDKAKGRVKANRDAFWMISKIKNWEKEDVVKKDEENYTQNLSDQLKDFLGTFTSWNQIDLISEFREALNTNEIREARDIVTGLETEIKTLDEEISEMEDEVRSQFAKGTPQSVINARVSRQTKDILRKRNQLSIKYNDAKWKLSNLTEQAKDEFQLLKDQQAQDKQDRLFDLNVMQFGYNILKDEKSYQRAIAKEQRDIENRLKLEEKLIELQSKHSWTKPITEKVWDDLYSYNPDTKSWDIAVKGSTSEKDKKISYQTDTFTGNTKVFENGNLKEIITPEGKRIYSSAFSTNDPYKWEGIITKSSWISRTDRNYNPIAVAVAVNEDWTINKKDPFAKEWTDALDKAWIKYTVEDWANFWKNKDLATIQFRDFENWLEWARALLWTSAFTWYKKQTWKKILDQLWVNSAADFKELSKAEQDNIIKEIYLVENNKENTLFNDSKWFDNNRIDSYEEFRRTWKVPESVSKWLRAWDVRRANEQFKQEYNEYIRNRNWEKIQLTPEKATELNEKVTDNEHYKAMNVLLPTINALNAYEKAFKASGINRIWQWSWELDSLHTSTLMALKEYLNLWVLNWPDLEVLEQMLPNPAKIMNSLQFITKGWLSSEAQNEYIQNTINNIRQRILEKVQSDKDSLDSIYWKYDKNDITALQNVDRIFETTTQSWDKKKTALKDRVRQKMNITVESSDQDIMKYLNEWKNFNKSLKTNK